MVYLAEALTMSNNFFLLRSSKNSQRRTLFTSDTHKKTDPRCFYNYPVFLPLNNTQSEIILFLHLNKYLIISSWG